MDCKQHPTIWTRMNCSNQDLEDYDEQDSSYEPDRVGQDADVNQLHMNASYFASMKSTFFLENTLAPHGISHIFRSEPIKCLCLLPT